MDILYVTPLWSGLSDIILDGKTEAKGMPAFIQPLKRLINQGHRVDFIIFHSYIPQDYNINASWLKDSPVFFTKWGLSPVERFSSPFNLYKTIRQVLKQKKYDFIYGHGSAGAIANIAANRHKIPCGLRLYGTFLYPETTVYSRKRLFIKHPLEYLAFRLEKSFLLITNDGTKGDKVYEYLKPDKEFYIFQFWLNGFDKFPPSTGCGVNELHLEKPYLLYPARISRWKRQHLAIDLLQIMHKKKFKLHLYFVGHLTETDYWQEIVKKIEEYHLDEYVHYLGTVEPGELGNLNINALAVLSLYEYSNLGNVVIEALSQGSVVLSLNDGSLTNIIEDGINGFLVDNIQEAADRITTLLTRPKLASEICHKAQQQALELFKTWDQRTDEEIQLIINAIKK